MKTAVVTVDAKAIGVTPTPVATTNVDGTTIIAPIAVRQTPLRRPDLAFRLSGIALEERPSGPGRKLMSSSKIGDEGRRGKVRTDCSQEQQPDILLTKNDSIDLSTVLIHRGWWSRSTTRCHAFEDEHSDVVAMDPVVEERVEHKIDQLVRLAEGVL